MNGVDVILAERIRQIVEEGYDLDHDYVYEPGMLALAGACYAHHAYHGTGVAPYPQFWPWDPKLWKFDRENPMHNLAKAGALIAAEIDCHLRRKGQNRTVSNPYSDKIGESDHVRLTRAELAALRQSHEDLDRHCQELEDDNARLQLQLSVARDAARTLTDQLADAWWVRAAAALTTLRAMTDEGGVLRSERAGGDSET